MGNCVGSDNGLPIPNEIEVVKAARTAANAGQSGRVFGAVHLASHSLTYCLMQEMPQHTAVFLDPRPPYVSAHFRACPPLACCMSLQRRVSGGPSRGYTSLTCLHRMSPARTGATNAGSKLIGASKPLAPSPQANSAPPQTTPPAAATAGGRAVGVLATRVNGVCRGSPSKPSSPHVQ